MHARTHIPMDVSKFQERFNGMICTLQLKKYIEINHYNIKFSHLFLNMSSFSDNMNFSIFRYFIIFIVSIKFKLCFVYLQL